MILRKAGTSSILVDDVSRPPELIQIKLEFADLITGAAELRDIPQQPEADQAGLDVLFHVYLLVPSYKRLGPSC
jgi:hypothetical protein